MLHRHASASVSADQCQPDSALVDRHLVDGKLRRTNVVDEPTLRHEVRASQLDDLGQTQQLAFGRQSVSQAVDTFMSTARKAIGK